MLFPAIKLPTGSLARVSSKNLLPAFEWFFANYDFTEEEILKATEYYVKHWEERDYSHMRTSLYFVRKQAVDKSFSSDLANYCELIKGGFQRENHVFTTKVV
jgi:hypothetical protein